MTDLATKDRSRLPKGAIIAGGIVGLAAFGAAVYLLRETRVEQPDYTVVERDGAVEIRDYPALLVAETVTNGSRERALGDGFSRLAGYIFGKDRGGSDAASDRRDGKIAMTAPVLSDGGGQEWRTRFVMPDRYTRATLPPTGEHVDIADVPARRVAVIRFSGMADDTELYAHERRLRGWMAERGLAAGATVYAFYNSPFMPGPLRRNEVMIAIEDSDAADSDNAVQPGIDTGG